MKTVLRTNNVLPICQHILGVTLYASISLHPSISFALPSVQLNKWQFNPKAEQLEIVLSAGTTPELFYLPEPPRLVLDLPNTKLGSVSTAKNYQGNIQRIRLSQLNPTVTRIVLDLAPGIVLEANQAKLQPLTAQNPTRWVLRPLISHNSTTSPTANTPFPSPSINLPPASSNLTPNTQQPFITVPPLNTQTPLTTFPTPANANSVTPTLPQENTNIPVIEFGQPIPR
ncbi:AMIN domain-containing protein [Richelia sinica]|uniref:AMIN domain-containing protein n=1 Tax=Richelia sinica TaxID=1357545 RepID=UPI001689FB13|nr:AMIN domain-containing protein [Richelia sinica]MBD2664519.1 AMIN domain-containing protein [Richelia sinica FACHB-800]